MNELLKIKQDFKAVRKVIERGSSLHKELSKELLNSLEEKCIDLYKIVELSKQLEEVEDLQIYEDNEVVLYQNGNRFELGVVRRKANSPDSYFINYHTGDTSACTHARNLHKISNLYAFEIRRRSCNE